MEIKQKDTVLVPPTEFKRMLSWQLSQVQSSPVFSRSKKREKKRKQSAAEPEDCDSDDDIGAYDDTYGSYAYIVVNSDGEEEVYYSAPESPLGSEGEDMDDVIAMVDVELPLQVKKPGGRSKKSKKRAKYLTRQAEAEFFRPLCDLVEDRLSLEVGQLELSSQAEVPPLVELCLRKIRKADLVQPGSSDLPYLIHSLLGHDRERRSIISGHVRWLERILAAYEIHIADKRSNLKERREDDVLAQHAYPLQDLWDSQLLADQLPAQGEGLHCPLPHPCLCYLTSDQWLEKHHLMRPLFHFASYFLPLFTSVGCVVPGSYSGSAPLSPSQLSAISYVNGFLRTRYKELTASLAATLKLWPAYVYWARGQLKLAADAFVAAVDSFTNVLDRAVALNELGRMFLHFGDAPTACKFFRRSADLKLAPHREDEGPRLFTPSRPLMQPCTFALEAAAWDCGWLDGSSARRAARAWAVVLKESSDIPRSLWYLHVAACESRLCVHAGRSVGEDPGSPMQDAATPSSTASCTFHWLKECIQLVSSHASSSYPLLFYHLSVLNAMMRRTDESFRAFVMFDNEYSGFLEWDEGRPGDLFSSSLPRYQRPHPWKTLIDMLIQQKLDHAPIMPLQWRVRLLHPLYPYASSEDVSYMADHAAPAIGLRLTGDGYLTADMHLDLPPLKCVVLDPYTGSLTFSRSAVLQHFYLNSFKKSEVGVLPWPLRVLESNQCVVELVMGSTPDVQLWRKPSSNYSASLHWYNSEGVHRRLDVRRIIRKHLRQAILDLAAEHNLNEKEATLDKMMEMGQYVHMDHLTAKVVESKFSTEKKGKGKQKKTGIRKFRNPSFYEFALQLSSHLVYGEATLMLCFMLTPEPEIRNPSYVGQALMFVNCSSWESFLQPKVYCVGDSRGFQHLWPCMETVQSFHTTHLKHIKFAMAACTERKPEAADNHTQMIFNENGEIVWKMTLHKPVAGRGRHHSPAIGSEDLEVHFSLGDRVFNWISRGQATAEILSYNTELKEQLTSVISNATELAGATPVPGLLFVHTSTGLSLLHPGSLEPVRIKHLEAELEQPRDQDDQNQIQFKGSELFFRIIKVYDIEGCLQNSDSPDIEAGISTTTSGSGMESGQMDASTEASDHGIPQENASRASEDEEQANTETDGREITLEMKKHLGSCDFGSCKVAFIINNRLIILHVPHRTEDVSILLDIRLPGKVTELHPMGKFGYMASVTQFPNRFREDVYWLSESGKLLGMLPCLGEGPRSFVSATLDANPALQENGEFQEDDGGGLYVFFSDGHGGICCIRPSVE